MCLLNSIEIGNHIIKTYNNDAVKYEDAFEFLKVGIERNEAIMFITEELTKDEIKERMRKEWKIDVDKLESSGDIILKSNTEWYFPDGIPNKERAAVLWRTLVDECMKNGKKGLRVVGDTSAFFNHGLSRELLDYELILERRFNFPMTAICQYNIENLQNSFTKEEIKSLENSHAIIIYNQ